MHNPKDALPAPLCGKGGRYVDKTTAVRKVRFDRDSDASLKFAAAQLSSGINPKDRVSLSLIMRRCLCLYREYLLERLSEPGSMDQEREQVRKTSRMPQKKSTVPRSPHRRAQAKPTTPLGSQAPKSLRRRSLFSR